MWAPWSEIHKPLGSCVAHSSWRVIMYTHTEWGWPSVGSRWAPALLSVFLAFVVLHLNAHLLGEPPIIKTVSLQFISLTTTCPCLILSFMVHILSLFLLSPFPNSPPFSSPFLLFVPLVLQYVKQRHLSFLFSLSPSPSYSLLSFPSLQMHPEHNTHSFLEWPWGRH